MELIYIALILSLTAVLMKMRGSKIKLPYEINRKRLPWVISYKAGRPYVSKKTHKEEVGRN